MEAVRRTICFPTLTLPSLLIRTNLLESDTIHPHHGILQVRLNLKRLFKNDQASVKLIEIISGFSGRNFKLDCLNTVFTDIYIKGAARGGAEGAQAPPLAIRILMFIS